jgi:hypothetical protein
MARLRDMGHVICLKEGLQSHIQVAASAHKGVSSRRAAAGQGSDIDGKKTDLDDVRRRPSGRLAGHFARGQFQLRKGDLSK